MLSRCFLILQWSDQYKAAFFMYIVQSTHWQVVTHKMLKKGLSNIEDSTQSVPDSQESLVSL